MSKPQQIPAAKGVPSRESDENMLSKSVPLSLYTHMPPKAPAHRPSNPTVVPPADLQLPPLDERLDAEEEPGPRSLTNNPRGHFPSSVPANFVLRASFGQTPPSRIRLRPASEDHEDNYSDGLSQPSSLGRASTGGRNSTCLELMEENLTGAPQLTGRDSGATQGSRTSSVTDPNMISGPRTSAADDEGMFPIEM